MAVRAASMRLNRYKEPVPKIGIAEGKATAVLSVQDPAGGMRAFEFNLGPCSAAPSSTFAETNNSQPPLAQSLKNPRFSSYIGSGPLIIFLTMPARSKCTCIIEFHTPLSLYRYDHTSRSDSAR